MSKKEEKVENPILEEQMKFLEIDENFRLRLKSQINFFEDKAAKSKKKYNFIKVTSIVCGVLTSLAISLAFAFQPLFVWFGVAALVFSTLVLACYQLEEFCNFGSTWTNYRLIANRLQSEVNLYISKSGRYKYQDDETNRHVFIETIELIIEGTDITFSSLNNDSKTLSSINNIRNQIDKMNM